MSQWGDKIWAKWFDPPFDTRGDSVLAAVLGLGASLGGALLLYLQLDAVLSEGEASCIGLLTGAVFGGFLGLPLLSLSRSLGRRTRFPRLTRAAGGLVMLSLAGAIYGGVARPILLTAPNEYAGSAGAAYERVYRRGGEVVRRELVSGAQVSIEKWAQAAGMSVAPVITLGLLAIFPLAIALPIWTPSGSRAEHPDLPRATAEEDPAWLRAMVGRCPSCDRRVIQRWRRCPFCRALLPSSYRHRPDAEEGLTFLASLGVAVGAFIAIEGAVLHLDSDPLAPTVLAVALFFLSAHACLKWWSWALLPVRLAWPVLALAIVLVLWRTPLVALLVACLPIGVSIKLALIGGRLSAYVHGTLERDVGAEMPIAGLEGNACRRCGRRSASIIAPMWCLSMVVMTTRQSGFPRLLCPFHARVAAIPATLVSALVGWWGVPWGFLWTPAVLWQNVADGGIRLERHTALAQIAAAREGPLSIGWRDVAVFTLVLLVIIVGFVWSKP